jgi:lipopolysaccharide/colanic/teichoic acid biosynthesis glycosyltransferase
VEASQPWPAVDIDAVAATPHLTVMNGNANAHAHALPLPLPRGIASEAGVDRLRGHIAWDAFLPERASSTSWAIQQVAKRALDIVVSLTLLTLLSPLFVLVAVLVKLTSRGPALYEFRVLGKNARPFVAYKFRTMVENADDLKPALLSHNEMQGPAFKMRNDPRITPLGRWLRKLSIDELPQLWSVLVGDMSLVGPRPPFADEFVQYKSWQWGRLAVTPGITCIWQVTGRSDIRDFDDWAALDAEYIKTWSLGLDLKILLMTIPAVLRGRGAY